MPSSSGRRPRSVSPSSGSSRASSSSCPAAAAASSSGSRRRRARRAVENGAKGSPSAPISTQPPTAKTAPSRSATVANSSISRVFPTPASPPRSSACGSPVPGVRAPLPPAARASASRRTPSSSARPTNTGLTDLVSTGPSIAQRSDGAAPVIGWPAVGADPGAGRGASALPGGRPTPVRPASPGVGGGRPRYGRPPGPGVHAARANRCRRGPRLCACPSVSFRPDRWPAPRRSARRPRRASVTSRWFCASRISSADRIWWISYSNISYPS